MATKSGQQEPEKAEVVEELLDSLDTALDRVKVLYEQYFLGIQKQPPSYLHTDVERKIRDIAQLQVRNTALRYRFVTLQQKFGAYNAYWRRTLRQIENGTYTRNLSKIGRQSARTGAAVPEEILAAMPKRMREQVQRDREAALALARLRDPQRADDPELLTLADEDVDIDLEDLEPAAYIQESSDLRRDMRTAGGAHRVNEADVDFDLDAFFASVTSEGEPDLEEATPVFMPRPRIALTEPRPPEPRRIGHPRPGTASGSVAAIPEATPLPSSGPSNAGRASTGQPGAEPPKAGRPPTGQPGAEPLKAGRPPTGQPGEPASSGRPPTGQPGEPASSGRPPTAYPSGESPNGQPPEPQIGVRVVPHERRAPVKGAATQALPRSPRSPPPTPPAGRPTLASSHHAGQRPVTPHAGQPPVTPIAVLPPETAAWDAPDARAPSVAPAAMGPPTQAPLQVMTSQPATPPSGTSPASKPPAPASTQTMRAPAKPVAPALPTPDAVKPRIPAAASATASSLMPALTQPMTPSAARPLMPPSQATRPSPVAPGASALRAPTAVETMTGPFPRIPSPPALLSKRRPDAGASPVTVERDDASGPATSVSAVESVPPPRSPPPQQRSPERAPPRERTVPPVELTPGPERAPSSERTPAPERAPSSECTPAPERAPSSERTPAPERAPWSERTPAPEPAPWSERTPAPEQAPWSERTPAPERAPSSERTPAPERAPSSERRAPQRPAVGQSAGERGTPPRQGPPPGVSDAEVTALYAKYVKAKETLGEDAGPEAYGKLLKTINAQAPKIMEQYKAKGVDFSVVVKDNQVVIRAKPKP